MKFLTEKLLIYSKCCSFPKVCIASIEIVVTPRERKYGWAGLGHSEKIMAWLYSIIGLVAAY